MSGRLGQDYITINKVLNGVANMLSTSMENKVMDFISDNIYKILFIVAIILSAIVRIHLSPYCISGDYQYFLTSWVEEYRKYGFIEAFGKEIGNYYIPYNILLNIIARFPWEPWVLISFFSCFADYVGAYFVYKIIYLINADKNVDNRKIRAMLAAITVLFLPMVVMNGSLWKQCDSIYTAFILGSIYYMLTEKYTRSFIIYSIGFCFKLQAIFMLPFLLIIYVVYRKYSILNFFYIPLFYFLFGIPAVIMKRGLRSTYLVYFKQTEASAMSENAPTIYRFGLNDSYEIWGVPALCFIIMIMMLITVLLLKYTKSISNSEMVLLAAITAWTTFMFLPAMHERYNYVAIILITALAVGRYSKLLWPAIVLNVVTQINYRNYFYEDYSIPTILLAVPYTIVYIGTVVICLNKMSKINK